jgi:hypothetical protein
MMRPKQPLAVERKRLLLKKCASSKRLPWPSEYAEELRDENVQLELERSDENDMTSNSNPVELVEFVSAKRLSLSVEKPWSSEYPVELSEDEFLLLQDERSNEDDITGKPDPAGGLPSTNAKRRWKSVFLPIKAIVHMSSSQEPASKSKNKTNGEVLAERKVSNPVSTGSRDNEDGLQIPDRPISKADRLKSVRRQLDNWNEQKKLDTSVNKSAGEFSDEETAVFGMERFKRRREKHTFFKPSHFQSRNNGTLTRKSCSDRKLAVPTETRHASASAPELGYAHVDEESSGPKEERSNDEEFTCKSNPVGVVESPSAKKRLSSSVEKKLSSEYAVELNDEFLRVEEEGSNENGKTRKSDDPPLGLSFPNAKQRWKSVFLPVKAIVRMTSSQEPASKSKNKTITVEVLAETKVSNPVSTGSRDSEEGLQIPDRRIISEADRLKFVRRELDNWNEKKNLDTSVNTGADEFSDEESAVFGMERFKRREKHRISKPSHFQSRNYGALIRRSCSERKLAVPTETKHASASELGYAHDDDQSSDPEEERSNYDDFTRKPNPVGLVEFASAKKRLLSSPVENQLSSEYAVELNDEFLRVKEERSNEDDMTRKADNPLRLSSTNAKRRWKSVLLPVKAIARMASSSQEPSSKSKNKTAGEVLAETEVSNPILVAGSKDNEDGSRIPNRPTISEADRLKFVRRELDNWNEKKKLDSFVNKSADEFSDEESAHFGMERFKGREKHIVSKSSQFQSRNNEREVRPLLTEIFLEENTQHAFASELAALGYVQDDDDGYDSLDPSERSAKLKATAARLRREYKELTGKDKVFRIEAEEDAVRTNAEDTLTLTKPSEARYEDELVSSDYDSNEDRLQIDEDAWRVVELVGAKTKNQQSQSTTTKRAKHNTMKSDILDSSRRKRFKSRTMRKKEEKRPSRANSRSRKDKSLHSNGDGSTLLANESEVSENAGTPGKDVCNTPLTPTSAMAKTSMISRSEVNDMLLEMERQWQCKLEALEKQLGDRLEKKTSRLSEILELKIPSSSSRLD